MLQQCNTRDCFCNINARIYFCAFSIMKDVRRNLYMSENTVLEIKNLVKNYGTKGFKTSVLKGLDLKVKYCDHGTKWFWKNNVIKYSIYN